MIKKNVKEICRRSHRKLSGNIKIIRFEQELVILLQMFAARQFVCAMVIFAISCFFMVIFGVYP